MAIWFTADLHLGHKNILTYCSRPFVDVESMGVYLEEMWNGAVMEDDVVWVLGDFAMGDVQETLKSVGRLKGRKHLVVGNHDRPFRKPQGVWERRYIDAGFDGVHHGWVNLDLGGEQFLACHFPYTSDPRGRTRFDVDRPSDTGLFLLHGHVHGRWRRYGNQIDVGVDAWGGRLVAADSILKMVGAGDVGPLGWNVP